MLKVMDLLGADGVGSDEIVHLAGIGEGDLVDPDQLATLQDVRCPPSSTSYKLLQNPL